MPAVSVAQQGFMGAALGRAKAGKPRASDPQMSLDKLKEFAATPHAGLPKRKGKKSKGKYKRMARMI